MSKIIFISNRLPVTISRGKSRFTYQKSIGGLATGLKSYHEQANSIWVGWPGLLEEDTTEHEKTNIQKTLRNTYHCLPVFLSRQDYELYYHGFSNETIWPLFHYFSEKTQYDSRAWEAYQTVNRKFFEAVEPMIEPGDVVWIHDYQLMLLPKLIKDAHPDTQVGFFLHIPFPSYEVFRQLIWREDILHGLLGADLIGFHTYGYVRHFLSSVQRILGYSHNLNLIQTEDRFVQADTFPMGINYDYFHTVKLKAPPKGKGLTGGGSGLHTILSIDRLDYTKGIPERLLAFDRFLERYPEYREKVRLQLIVAPSREAVDSYDELRREVNELVGQINGRYATINWIPIWFFYRPFTQDELIGFYRQSDVLLVTPLRDGMNLVAKEYIASRTDYQGMVVISETAGAAGELGEAVIVNATNRDGIAEGIKTALEMPVEEKTARNRIMHHRLRRYNVDFWARDFLNALSHTVNVSREKTPYLNIDKDSSVIQTAYQQTKNRVLFLDYDGTLVGFAPTPERARPTQELRQLLAKLAADAKNTVVIISGRDRWTMDEWFKGLNLHLIASHGLWTKNCSQCGWTMTVTLNNDWIDSVRHVLEVFSDRIPGSFIEE
ncbi:MAG TPA: bifunctional alpha,alpha-trehalose-phosphate synthase (UDP-forming)/trehalose-phosphatase, partial [Candidatus Limiplasma sp.]|nr:bifunctional alpha,alpha-trehalose-phosphate synthase (UDP-forming)/trehalose-phosphatase [Candidatus Limiplasma sp.]